MKKEFRKDVLKTVSVVASHSTFCNRCGKERKENIENDGYSYCTEREIHEFSCNFGYYSGFDGERWNFDLCEECLKDIIRTFKIVPGGFMQDEYNVLEDITHQKVFDNWKKTGEWDEYKYHTYEQLVELRNGFNEAYIDEIIKDHFPEKFQ